MGFLRSNEKTIADKMEIEKVKKYLEKDDDDKNSSTIDALPPRFYELLIMQGLSLDLVEPGRLLCTLRIPPTLLNAGNFLHGGATATLVDVVGSAVIYTVGAPSPTTGVSVEINVSYLDAAYADEEIAIEAKALRVGNAIAVVTVELRNKSSGKIIAHGRHTKYLAVSSKM